MATMTRTETPALPSSDSWRQTAARLADGRRVWTGLCGLTLSGREVAEHIAAAHTWLREHGWTPGSDRSLNAALVATAPGGRSDVSAQMAALNLFSVVLEAALNSPRAHLLAEAWEARPGRTWPQVSDLLAVTAQFAREHGPAGGGRGE